METQIVVNNPIRDQHVTIADFMLESILAMIGQKPNVSAYSVTNYSWATNEKLELQIDDKTKLQLCIERSK